MMKLNVVIVLALTVVAWNVYDCHAAVWGDKHVAHAHNKKRREEWASNMKLLAWDNTLAAQAATWASRCVIKHDPHSKAGENIYASGASYSYSMFQEAVDGWFSEKKDYNVPHMHCHSGKVCGHYTAMVWANTERVGCAAQHCPGGIHGFWHTGTVVVCRYAPAGNVQGQKMYKKGPACSACDDGWPGCDNGLCSRVPPPPPEKPINPQEKDENEVHVTITDYEGSA